MLDLVRPETDDVELQRVLETASAFAHELDLQALGPFQKPIRMGELEALLRHHLTDHGNRGGRTRDD
jgi:hypothetical protein